ncbi:MAG TPA: hypothetical protein VID74_08910 [Gemmatimonadales bacterium]|jgi:hypothetical protein
MASFRIAVRSAARLRRQVRAGLAASALAAASLAAQGNPQCDAFGSGPFGGAQERNICNAGVDGASVFAPVGGLLVAGGNPFLGASGGLGGFGHLGVTLRVNATRVVIPDFNYNGSGTVVGARQTLYAPAPLVEAGFGVFRGLRGGNLALDVLGSAQLLPTKLIDDVHVDVNARRIGSIALGLGIGGRLTLLGEGRAWPAVVVSVMRRSLPRIGVGSILGGDSYQFASDLAGVGYRAVVAKRFGRLHVSAGAGWTDYSASADIFVANPITGLAEAPIHLDIRDSRALVFLDGGLALRSVYLIAEAGIQRGKDLALVTTFTGDDPAANRFFASAGLRFGF